MTTEMGKKMRSPKVDKQGQRGQNARCQTVVMGSSELTGTRASDCTIRLDWDEIVQETQERG